MGVFTFVCKKSGDDWSAKQLKGDLEAEADNTFNLQRKLVQAALSADSSGAVQSSFAHVTPSSAVFQVIVGGGPAGAFIGGGAAAAPAASGGGGAAAEAPAAEKKEEKKEEEESDDDMGFSLFD
ncbi:60S acidic ribosomal protein P3-like [Andrographis paniculata]|uniref:60S acidic ribosomal protein P3-like n=1 Tax=Andrographis paniculata TaxID=175694 RepID=UPI0021E739D5|nr:60S acidic ribosomal protein P3-like [Andrographis paniculata]